MIGEKWIQTWMSPLKKSKDTKVTKFFTNSKHLDSKGFGEK